MCGGEPKCHQSDLYGRNTVKSSESLWNEQNRISLYGVHKLLPKAMLNDMQHPGSLVKLQFFPIQIPQLDLFQQIKEFITGKKRLTD